MKVLAVDLRYPPNLLSDEAINLFYCLLQRAPCNRIPTRRLLAEHPWVRMALVPANAQVAPAVALHSSAGAPSTNTCDGASPASPAAVVAANAVTLTSAVATPPAARAASPAPVHIAAGGAAATAADADIATAPPAATVVASVIATPSPKRERPPSPEARAHVRAFNAAKTRVATAVAAASAPFAAAFGGSQAPRESHTCLPVVAPLIRQRPTVPGQRQTALSAALPTRKASVSPTRKAPSAGAVAAASTPEAVAVAAAPASPFTPTVAMEAEAAEVTAETSNAETNVN